MPNDVRTLGRAENDGQSADRLESDPGRWANVEADHSVERDLAMARCKGGDCADGCDLIARERCAHSHAGFEQDAVRKDVTARCRNANRGSTKRAGKVVIVYAVAGPCRQKHRNVKV